jgi:hypothetical protein
MAKEYKRLPQSTVSPADIRHIIGGVEVASIPEMLARLGIEVGKTSGPIYNLVHAQRGALLPDPIVYGTTYFYPADVLAEVVSKVQQNAGTKKEQNVKMTRLMERLKSNPELAEMLLGLLD